MAALVVSPLLAVLLVLGAHLTKVREIDNISSVRHADAFQVPQPGGRPEGGYPRPPQGGRPPVVGQIPDGQPQAPPAIGSPPYGGPPSAGGSPSEGRKD